MHRLARDLLCATGCVALCAGGATAQEKSSERQIVEGWKGQKVTVLGLRTPRCPSADGRLDHVRTTTERDYGYGEKKPRHMEPEYVGKTGTILEVAYREGGMALGSREVQVALEGGGTVFVSDREHLGFHSELEAARKWIGRSLWTRFATSLAADESLCAESGGVKVRDLPHLARLTVTEVEFGNNFHPIVMHVKTDDGRNGWIEPENYKFTALRVARLGWPALEEVFYTEDPRQNHADAAPEMWEAAKSHKVMAGMSRSLAEVACGELDEIGYSIDPEKDALGKVYRCRPGKTDLVVVNERVIKVMETQRRQ